MVRRSGGGSPLCLLLMTACAPRMGGLARWVQINQLARSSMRRDVAPRCQEPMAAHGVRSEENAGCTRSRTRKV